MRRDRLGDARAHNLDLGGYIAAHGLLLPTWNGYQQGQHPASVSHVYPCRSATLEGLCVLPCCLDDIAPVWSVGPGWIRGARLDRVEAGADARLDRWDGRRKSKVGHHDSPFGALVGAARGGYRIQPIPVVPSTPILSPSVCWAQSRFLAHGTERERQFATKYTPRNSRLLSTRRRLCRSGGIQRTLICFSLRCRNAPRTSRRRSLTLGSASAVAQTPIVYVWCPRTDAPLVITGEVTSGGITRTITRSVVGWDNYDRLPDVVHSFGDFAAASLGDRPRLARSSSTPRQILDWLRRSSSLPALPPHKAQIHLVDVALGARPRIAERRVR